jgi:hypothetical protein
VSSKPLPLAWKPVFEAPVVPKSVWLPVAGGWYCSRDMAVMCGVVMLLLVFGERDCFGLVGWLVSVARAVELLQSPLASQASLVSAKHVKALPSFGPLVLCSRKAPRLGSLCWRRCRAWRERSECLFSLTKRDKTFAPPEEARLISRTNTSSLPHVS